MSDIALWEAEFAAMNAQWDEEHPEEAAKLKQTMAVLGSYWISPTGLRQALADDPEWAAEIGYAIGQLVERVREQKGCNSNPPENGPEVQQYDGTGSAP